MFNPQETYVIKKLYKKQHLVSQNYRKTTVVLPYVTQGFELCDSLIRYLKMIYCYTKVFFSIERTTAMCMTNVRQFM